MKRWVLLLLCVGFLVRFYYFLYPFGRASFFTVDESVYGVQSLQILQGERPVFYPAQVYTGSFSAYLSALLYFLFGFQPLFLKVVPLFFSLVFIFLNYQLARAVFRSRAVILSVLLVTVLGTPFWNNWASRAGTGYVEASTVGNLLLLLCLRVVSRRFDAAKSALNFFVLGGLAGLGFWVQPTVVYYLLPVAIYFVINGRPYLRQKSFYFSLLGLVVGGAPVILYNLSHAGATTQTLLKMPWGMKASLVKLISQGFPVLLGVRTSNSTDDFFPLLAVLVGLLFLLALIFFLLQAFRALKENFRASQSRLNPPDLIWLTFFSTIGFFLISTPFNQFAIEPRYVFSLYSTIPLIWGYFLGSLYPSRKRWLAVALALYGFNWFLGVRLAGPLSFVDPYPPEKLVSFLKEKRLRHFISDPALGHRVMFLSGLTIKTGIRGGGITEGRFPQINAEVITRRDSDNLSVGFISLKDSPLAPLFESEAKSFAKRGYDKMTVEPSFTVWLPRPE